MDDLYKMAFWLYFAQPLGGFLVCFIFGVRWCIYLGFEPSGYRYYHLCFGYKCLFPTSFSLLHSTCGQSSDLLKNKSNDNILNYSHLVTTIHQYNPIW